MPPYRVGPSCAARQGPPHGVRGVLSGLLLLVLGVSVHLGYRALVTAPWLPSPHACPTLAMRVCLDHLIIDYFCMLAANARVA